MSRRGGDTQLAKMMLRRLAQKMDEENNDNVEQLQMPLNGLVRASKTSGDCIREENGFPKVVKAMQKHADKPEVIQKVMKILFQSLVSTCKKNRGICALDMHNAQVVLEIIKVLCNHLQERALIRTTIDFMSLLTKDFTTGNKNLVERFRLWCIDNSLLTAVVGAMKQYLDDVEICALGVDIIYWLQCSREPFVSSAICGPNLNIAIEAALCDHKGKLEPGSTDECESFLINNPELMAAMYQDPVLGVLQQAYDLHKDANGIIRKCGREVQYAAIEFQKEHAKLFCCMNSECRKRLPKKERLICTRCRSAIYCSKECQIAAWKNSHKKECNKTK